MINHISPLFQHVRSPGVSSKPTGRSTWLPKAGRSISAIQVLIPGNPFALKMWIDLLYKQWL